MPFAHDFLDAFGIHQRGAADTEEFPRRQFHLQRGERSACVVNRTFRVQSQIIPMRHDRVDFLRPQQYNAPPVFHTDGFLESLSSRSFSRLLRIAAPPQSKARALHRLLEARGRKRFQQIIHGMDTKGPRGVAVIGGDKNNCWRDIAVKGFQYFEAIHAAQSYAEEREAGDDACGWRRRPTCRWRTHRPTPDLFRPPSIPGEPREFAGSLERSMPG